MLNLAISFGLASNPARFELLLKIGPCELYLEKRLVHVDDAILLKNKIKKTSNDIKFSFLTNLKSQN